VALDLVQIAQKEERQIPAFAASAQHFLQEQATEVCRPSAFGPEFGDLSDPFTLTFGNGNI
jgi:hypothetical protein